MIAKEIDEENKREKAIKELLKCKKCIYFDKTVYRCKEKECIKWELITNQIKK